MNAKSIITFNLNGILESKFSSVRRMMMTTVCESLLVLNCMIHLH